MSGAEGSDGTVDLRRAGPPHGVDLFAYALLSADVAEGDRPLSEILRERGLTDEQWTEAAIFWTRLMAEDARPNESGDVQPRVALAFSEAFARAQDEKRPLVELSVAEWAALVHDLESASSGPYPVLARRGLCMADYARLVRHWARAVAANPALAREYEAVTRGAPSDLGKGDEGV